MTLNGSLALGAAAIEANRVALQVIGNNISNAGTAGYVRQDVTLAPIVPTRAGSLSIGNGVSVAGVSMKIDQFLAERARIASGQFSAADARSTYLKRAEQLVGSLSDSSLSSKLDAFATALQAVQNQPNDATLRGLATRAGQNLTDTIRLMRSNLDDLREDVNKEVATSVNTINGAVENIRKLNTLIVSAESGTDQSKAGSLRTVRDQELAKITDLIDVKVIEQPTGAINLYTGNDYLLLDGQVQRVAISETNDRDLQTQTLVLEDSQVAVGRSAGRIGGAQEARDQDIAGVIDALDSLSRQLIFDFNKAHASGQGSVNFTDVTSQYAVRPPGGAALALNNPSNGLEFVPNNGSFEIRVGPKGGQQQTTIINVNPSVDTLSSIAAKINASALGAGAATVTSQGALRIAAPSGVEFSFGSDTSGFLAAIGVNTFFTGTNSADININATITATPGYLAVAQNGQLGDTANAQDLVDVLKSTNRTGGLPTIGDLSTGLIESLAGASNDARVAAQTLQTSKQALDAENLSITGVSLDEETIKLVSFQRSFQASARYISTINDLLQTIIDLGR